jgi:hypothetical protein
LFVSERVYWIILITIFTALALIIWLWLVPYQVLEYNLAVNLFTSSIFMVATVISLSWLISLREKAEWHAVREEVFFRIRLEISNLFDLAIEYFEGGFELKMQLMQEKDKQKNMDMIYNGLEKIGNSDITKNNLVVAHFFKDLQEIENFQNVDKNIANIQGIYSKHLPADITVSLMKLQHCIWALESYKKLDDNFGKLQNTISGPLISTAKDILELNRLEMLKAPLVKLLKEIQILYSIEELKFNYPII